MEEREKVASNPRESSKGEGGLPSMGREARKKDSEVGKATRNKETIHPWEGKQGRRTAR